MTDIRQRVIGLIADELGVPDIDLTDDKTMESLGADSLDMLSTSIRIEVDFNDSFEINKEWNDSTTVADIIADVTAALERRS